MLILSIDTSGKSGGISLAEGGSNSFRVLDSSPIAGGTFSAQLVPTLSSLLQKHGLAAKDIEGFAATSGPGSFTGLRVGLSAIKGLAEVLKKPIATVSLLEALASLAKENGRVVGALDAGRQEIFFGLYEISDGRAILIAERLLSQQEFFQEIRNVGPVAVITSDRAVAELASQAAGAVQEVVRPGSELIASIGLKKLLDGETVSVEDLDANYLRRSDAEIFSKKL